MFHPLKNTGFFPVSKNLASRQVSLRWGGGGALVLYLCALFIGGDLPASPRRVKRDFMTHEVCQDHSCQTILSFLSLVPQLEHEQILCFE